MDAQRDGGRKRKREREEVYLNICKFSKVKHVYTIKIQINKWCHISKWCLTQFNSIAFNLQTDIKQNPYATIWMPRIMNKTYIFN